jgi:hypothetical protein
MTEEQKQGGPFGGLSAAEAGRRSGERKREMAAALADPSTSNGRIESALRSKAEAGDVSAARELRELGALTASGENRDRDVRLLELLTREQRALISRWIREGSDGE